MVPTTYIYRGGVGAMIVSRVSNCGLSRPPNPIDSFGVLR